MSLTDHQGNMLGGTLPVDLYGFHMTSKERIWLVGAPKIVENNHLKGQTFDQKVQF